jgi:hypothetical protein
MPAISVVPSKENMSRPSLVRFDQTAGQIWADRVDIGVH